MTRQQRRQQDRQQAKRNAGAIAETPVKTAVLWAFSPHSWRAAPAAPTPAPASPEQAPAIAINCNQETVRQTDLLHDTQSDGGGAGVITKRCTSCKKLKPLDAYSKASASHDGLSYYCKGCSILDQKFQQAKRANKKPSLKAAKNQRPLRPPEKICAGCGTNNLYQHYKKDPDGLFGISDYCVLCSAIIAFEKGELVPDPYPQMRGGRVIENYHQDDQHDEQDDEEYEEKPRRRKHP